MHIIKVWNDRVIRFRNNGEEACLTDLANASGRQVSDWMRLKTTQDYLEVFFGSTGIPRDELIRTIVDGPNEDRGTWAHRRVALRFAQWCSPELAVQVDAWVEELLLTGKVELSKYSTQSRALLEVTHFAIDSIFANTPLRPEIIAGLKLNAAQEILPQLATYLEPSRSVLINSTAQEFQLLTPTDIGNRLGISAVKVNQKLIEKGLQVKNLSKKSKKDCSYTPTSRGQEFSDLTLAMGKGSDSTTYQQLRWYESVLSLL